MNQQFAGGAASERGLRAAVAAYLSELAPAEREAAAVELQRLMRWFGGERDLGAVTPMELERYQQHLAESGIDPALRLGPVKEFFAFAHSRGLTPSNLGPQIRLRRKAGGRPAAGGGQAEAGRIEVTREGYEHLQRELERLEQEVVPQVRADLQAAYADKDFRENAPYDAAKEHFGAIQGRINKLRATLSAATVVGAPAQTERVALGSTIVVRDLAADEELTYTLVGPGEVGPRRGRISINSPVGSALYDRTSGETVEVQTPVGPVAYRIERIVRE